MCDLSGEVLAWLSVCSKVQTCIWPSWCHCLSLSLVSVKSRLVLPFWYWLTRVVLDKGPLNVCVCVCVRHEKSADFSDFSLADKSIISADFYRSYVIAFRHRQSKEASILSCHTMRKLRSCMDSDNERNYARCTQVRKTMQGLDGHQDTDRTPRWRVNQNDRGQR